MWDLIEINLTGIFFTWGNNQETMVMSRIDRIFCNVSYEALFPLASARALPRVGSDHTPIFGNLIWTNHQGKVVLNLRNGVVLDHIFRMWLGKLGIRKVDIEIVWINGRQRLDALGVQPKAGVLT